MTKILCVVPYISGAIYQMIFIYVTHVEKDNVSRIFFHFLKNLFLGIIKGVKRQKMAHNLTKNFVCLTQYLRRLTSYDCDFW